MKHKTRTLIILTTLVSLTLHMINQLMHSFFTLKDLLACRENQYYEWRFGKVRYLKRGSGTPVLLIHDLLPGSSLYEFHKLIEQLSKTHEVYALDLLGYGLSDKPNMTYTNYLYLQLVNDFIKNIIGRKTDVIATGDSAPITIMTVHNEPENINRMILINPQSIYQLNKIPSKRTKLLKMLIDLPILGSFIYNVFTTRSFLEKDFYNDYFYNPANMKEEYIDSYLEACHTGNANAKYVYSSYIGKYMNTNILHALKEINHGIFIIAGKEKQDIETVLDNYVYYNNSIETAYIPKTKHLPHIEAAEDVIAHIEIFLS